MSVGVSSGEWSKNKLLLTVTNISIIFNSSLKFCYKYYKIQNFIWATYLVEILRFGQFPV